MQSFEPLFKQKILDRELRHFHIDNIPNLNARRNELARWKYSIENSDLDKTKETSVQGSFLERVWGNVLNYPSVIGNEEYNQDQEHTSAMDGTEADSALGFFTTSYKDVRVVIELKDAKTDLDKKQHRRGNQTPVEQAFSYLYKNGSNCRWVIVSNFKEIRLYHRNTGMIKYQQFFITDLDDDQRFKEFYYILCKENLINKTSKSVTEVLFENAEQAEQDVSKKFYNDYTKLRTLLFESLKEHNPTTNHLLLFEKAQKIMDRFVFICFCEDKDLLPKNTFSKVIEAATTSFDVSKYRIWRQLNGLFQSIDVGNPSMNINKFNGGLFKQDIILDNLNIPDDILLKFTDLASVDFDSDLNVNILGHIFEHSISDIERIKAQINGETIEDNQLTRKRDGIYYTPSYVTNYIVDKTIGRWMEDAKANIKNNLFAPSYLTYTAFNKNGTPNLKSIVEIKEWQEIPEDASSLDSKNLKALTNLHIDFYERYSERLLNLRVLDPACGSGAFLNSAFQYILREIRDVNVQLENLRGGTISLFDIDKQILENNLYGVDINAESVEITKLSLWLQTANKGKTLASLDHAIKCGNSLISTRTVAPLNAFDWHTEFRDVLENGGFDIVIGNPPYGAKLSTTEKQYIAEHYQTTEYNYDTYKSFLELGMNLLNENGYLGYITPNTYFILEKGATRLRQFFFDNYTLLNIVEMFNVFPDAIVEPAISIYKKCLATDDTLLEVISVPRNVKATDNFIIDGLRNTFAHRELKEKEAYLFNFRETTENKTLREKIAQKSKPLSNYFNVSAGVKPYEKGKGTPPQTKEMIKSRCYERFEQPDETWFKYIRGKSINRYTNLWDGEYIKYGENLAAPRNPEMFFNPKLFIRQTGDYPIATFDDTQMIGKNTIHCIYPKYEQSFSLKYALGFINSKLMKWVFQHDNFHIVGKPLAETKVVYVERLPIPKIDNQDIIINHVNTLLEKYQSRHSDAQRFINYVINLYHPNKLTEKLSACFENDFSNFIAELKKQKVKLSASDKMELLELFTEEQNKYNASTKQIVTTEKALDNFIYSIYDLTPEEIDMIEAL